jgi:hypothetical protein
MPQDDISIIDLALDEEPDSVPHVIVLQALSGAYRVLLGTQDGVQTGKASEQETGPDARELAIRHARELAREHGLSAIYLRVDV